MVHTGQRVREHARQMRRGPTRAEARVWSWLRGRKFGDCKFKRQFPIDRYVLDFYCPQLRLAIELDGQQHGNELAEYDGLRSLALAARRIEIVRIPNELLVRDSRLVEDIIREAIAKRR